MAEQKKRYPYIRVEGDAWKIMPKVVLVMAEGEEHDISAVVGSVSLKLSPQNAPWIHIDMIPAALEAESDNVKLSLDSLTEWRRSEDDEDKK
jgi:hypothetical protein